MVDRDQVNLKKKEEKNIQAIYMACYFSLFILTFEIFLIQMSIKMQD